MDKILGKDTALRHRRVRRALKALLDACWAADVAGDLPPQIDGGLLDEAKEALNDF